MGDANDGDTSNKAARSDGAFSSFCGSEPVPDGDISVDEDSAEGCKRDWLIILEVMWVGCEDLMTDSEGFGNDACV